MKCMECGADLYDGVKKCPYCKTPINAQADGKFKDYDFKYTISSPEELRSISGTNRGVSEGRRPAKKKKGLFGVSIRRIKKAETNTNKTNTQEIKDPKEKAREIAKSASRRAAEFVPEGLARYNVTGIDTSSVPKSTEPKSEVKEKTRRSSRTKKDRAKALSRSRRERTKRLSKPEINKKGIIAGAGVVLFAAVVVLGAVAIVNSAAKSTDKVSSYTYVKDNALHMVYKGKTSKISDQVITDSYLRYAEETETAVTPERAAKNAGIVKESKDGKLTYFFDNFDPETGSGALKLVKAGKTKKVTVISEAAHNSIVMSKDGSKILYLETTDKNGDMGVLYYWSEKLDEPLKIATDIDHHTFGFTGDEEWAVFIQNFNRVEMQGDLYVKNLEKVKDEKVKVDSAVCKIYGTNPGGAAYIYAKDYDKQDKTFDIYAINKKGRSIRLGERTNRDPLMQKTKDSLFVYGISEENKYDIYAVDINSGKKEKIASSASSILMLSKDEKTVIYDKVYTGKLADYYAYYKGKQPQMIAHNVVVDYNAVAEKPQMAVDQDTTKILYISEFEAFKGGGTLNMTTYKKGRIVSEEQVSEDVYAVYRAENGKFIVLKDYSVSKKIFDVYLFDGKELKLLKEDVSPELFQVSNLGDNVYCISDFGVEGKHGTLEKINLKGESETVLQAAFDFEVTSENDILIYKNLSVEDGKFDLSIRLDGSRKVKDVDQAVDEIIGY